MSYPILRFSCIIIKAKVMREDKFRLLAKKYIQNQCSGDEARLLFEYIKKGSFDDILKQEIDKVDWSPENKCQVKEIPDFGDVFERLKKNKIQSKKVNILINIICLSEVAAFLISLLVGAIPIKENKRLKVSAL